MNRVNKDNINKRVLAWYKNVMGHCMFYKGNDYVLRLVSLPSKSLEKEGGLKGFDASMALWSRCKWFPDIASRRGKSRPLSFLISYTRRLTLKPDIRGRIGCSLYFLLQRGRGRLVQARLHLSSSTILGKIQWLRVGEYSKNTDKKIMLVIHSNT